MKKRSRQRFLLGLLSLVLTGSTALQTKKRSTSSTRGGHMGEVSETEKEAFFGLWRLDFSKSESPAQVMSIAGAPWLIGRMVGMMPADCRMSRLEDTKISIKQITPMKKTESIFTDDGCENDADGYGEGSKKKAYWLRNEDKIVFIHETTNTNKGFTSKVTRTLTENNSLMTVQLESWKHDNSRKAKATRYFHRVLSEEEKKAAV